MWLELGKAVIQLLVLVVTTWLEKNAEKKKRMEAAQAAVLAGLKERDLSKITAGFDSVNRA